MFSNGRCVLSQCNTLLKLAYLLIIIMFSYNAHSDWLKQRAFSENRVRVDDIKQGFNKNILCESEKRNESGLFVSNKYGSRRSLLSTVE